MWLHLGPLKLLDSHLRLKIKMIKNIDARQKNLYSYKEVCQVPNIPFSRPFRMVLYVLRYNPIVYCNNLA